MESRKRIREFLSRYVRNKEYTDDQDIFAMGLVSSLFAMQLVMFIEKEFSIKVDNSDLDMENFKSLDSIDNFIQKKKMA